MSNEAINWATDMPVRGCTKLVLFVLANHANANDECYPGIDRLAEICGTSSRCIIRCIKELVKFGIVSKKMRHKRNGHKTSNLYSLNLDLKAEQVLSKTLRIESANTNKKSACLSDKLSHENDRPSDKLSHRPSDKCDATMCQIVTCTIEPKEEPKDICKVSQIIQNIFNHWQKVLDHPKAKLDRKRKASIEKAIKLGYSEDDLKMAIDGCSKNPFNMGENENNQKYDDINLIFRDSEHIEKFMGNFKNPPKSKGTSNNAEPWQGAI